MRSPPPPPGTKNITPTLQASHLFSFILLLMSNDIMLDNYRARNCHWAIAELLAPWMMFISHLTSSVHLTKEARQLQNGLYWFKSLHWIKSRPNLVIFEKSFSVFWCWTKQHETTVTVKLFLKWNTMITLMMTTKRTTKAAAGAFE